VAVGENLGLDAGMPCGFQVVAGTGEVLAEGRLKRLP
jgi:hypothetical protein